MILLAVDDDDGRLLENLFHSRKISRPNRMVLGTRTVMGFSLGLTGQLLTEI
jgi:hypothetical protein